jgi:glycosyltransferase involved in cell wall biosynthesis
VLLFTDTLGDINGVSRFIRNVAEQAEHTGRELTVLTSTRFGVPRARNIVNIEPVAAWKMPRYEHLELVWPRAGEMLGFARRFRPDAVHISTPGPVGCAGWWAARRLGVPRLGVYHTDFPAYVEHLFAHETLTAGTAWFMRRFYGPFRTIFARSEDYVGALVRLGLPRSRIMPLRPGIAVEQFHPRFRGSRGGGVVRVLSVGRISVEKNMPLLVRVWRLVETRLRDSGHAAELVVVGDGPYRAEMEHRLSGAHVRFFGFRHGEELSRAYADSDLFVFPSTTDTLGQVVMEAQASGLPVVVSDEGGPKEVVRDGRTGFVVKAGDVRAWAARVVGLVQDAACRARMSAAAHEFMQGYSMASSFEHFWSVHEAVCAAGAPRVRPAAEHEPAIAPAN